MNRYWVFTGDPDPQGPRVLEVTRSDRRVAEQDAEIFRSICRRKAWVVDAEEKASD